MSRLWFLPKKKLFWIVLFLISFTVIRCLRENKTKRIKVYPKYPKVVNFTNAVSSETKHSHSNSIILERLKVDSVTNIGNSTVFKLSDNRTMNFEEYAEIHPQCSSSFDLKEKAKSDINMLDMYSNLDFDDPTKYGDWQENWTISINPSRFTEADTLTVFLLPHAHNDPGWLHTFEEYYKHSVRSILNLMLKELSENPSMKFIWAEMSFFSLWWDEISQRKKLLLKKIVARKQLEFVTGGWVMPDEANSHFYSILIQLFEGNQFLKHHLNYTPRNGWSIDPFGLSPTMAYILQKSGFKNMLIQRTHYLVKQYLGNQQELEFNWRQNWDASGSTDILTHMEPFSSYTTQATCGPQMSVCRTFDYREPSSPYYWGINITERNIVNRSRELVEQYKKKGMLFKTNKVLVPLGMDFAWAKQREWDDMTRNYNYIANYVNSDKDLHAYMNYGTLDDYFEAVNSDIRSQSINLSNLSGDFFTYADKDSRYWSGYYTSRPFHKAIDRSLITHLRSAHMAYTMLNVELLSRFGNLTQFPFMKIFFGHLRDARRSLSLFQHHDGVTGTSKDYVMKDYAEKLYMAIAKCKYVMQDAIKILTHINKRNLFSELEGLPSLDYTSFFIELRPIFKKVPVYTLPTLEIIKLTPFGRPQAIVAVFNSLAQPRISLVSLKISIPEDERYSVQVTNLLHRIVDSELFPVFGYNDTISKNVFHLHFIDKLEAMSINNYYVTIRKNLPKETHSEPSASPPQVFLIRDGNNSEVNQHLKHNRFQVEFVKLPVDISNEHFTILFNSNGFIKTVVLNDTTFKLKVQMFTYGTQRQDDGSISGLYVFSPDGPATHLQLPKLRNIKIVKGKLHSYVEVSLRLLKHKIIIYNHAGMESNAIEIQNTIDINSKRDFELVMRFQSKISSGNISYTDLNAFQMIERKRFESLPLQGHYYPMPSACYIEDTKFRMTVLGGQPVGTASLYSGYIDVVMDRKLSDDDGLGVGQGSGIAIKNTNTFKLLIEGLNCEDPEMKDKAPMLSLSGHILRNLLLHPLQTYYTTLPKGPDLFKEPEDPFPLEISDYQSTTKIACDVEILDAIPLSDLKDSLDDHNYVPVGEAALLLHRFGFDGRFKTSSSFLKCSSSKSSFGQVTLGEIFNSLIERDVIQKSLSFVHTLRNIQAGNKLLLDPMEIYAFQIRFKSTTGKTENIIIK